VSNSLLKVKSHNALLRMLLVRIHEYIKSVLRYTFLIWIPTNWTLYLREQGCDYFSKPKESVSKNNGKCCFDRMLGTHCCDNLDNTINLYT